MPYIQENYWPKRLFQLIVLLVIALPQMANSQGVALDYGVIISATQSQAEALLKQLRSGFDFAVLAKEKSIDDTAKDGGYLGRYLPTQLRAEYQSAAQALKAGHFSDVIPISSGFAILTVFTVAPKTQDLDAERIRSLATRGTVVDTIDISGMASANAAFSACRP